MPVARQGHASPRDAHASARAAGVLVIAPTARETGRAQRTGAAATAVVGIGRRSAHSLAVLLETQRPAVVLSLGFAGALRPGLRTGLLTLHERAVTLPVAAAKAPASKAGGVWWGTLAESAIPAPVALDGRLHAVAQRALSAAGLSVAEGPLLTTPRVLLTPEAKETAGLETGALAVDMEGYWLADTAARMGVPMVAVRVILDSMERRLPPMVADIIEDGGHNEWRHAIGALGRPTTAAALVPLALSSARAARALARAVDALVPALAAAVGGDS